MDGKSKQCQKCYHDQRRETFIAKRGTCRECLSKPIVYIKYGLCRKCRKQLEDYKSYSKDYSKNSYAAKRQQVFDYYGNECKCCGENHAVFLSIDHINGGGTQHRKTISPSGGGTAFYLWLVREGFPKGFQTLCMNCQWGKRYGICPHQQ